MKFADIMALAKSGFTYSNIKELMEMDTGDSKELVIEDATPGIIDNSPDERGAGVDTFEASAPAPEKQSTDYGEEIKKLQMELQKTKEDLAKAQKANAHVDVSGNKPDPQSTLDDIVRSFM